MVVGGGQRGVGGGGNGKRGGGKGAVGWQGCGVGGEVNSTTAGPILEGVQVVKYICR